MVTLYVDGVTYDPYLVTDDWPIHPSQIDVQLTVGACWQGEQPKLMMTPDSGSRYSVNVLQQNSFILWAILKKKCN